MPDDRAPAPRGSGPRSGAGSALSKPRARVFPTGLRAPAVPPASSCQPAYLGRAVPARIGRPARARAGRARSPARRLACPSTAGGRRCSTRTCRPSTASNTQAPGVVELRHARHFPPADEHVAVGQQLHAALAAREDVRGGCTASSSVAVIACSSTSEDQPARELLDRRRRAVVEHRQRPVGLAARVVLPSEAAPAPMREVAALAAQAPDDRAVAVELVDGVRAAARRPAGCRRRPGRRS